MKAALKIVNLLIILGVVVGLQAQANTDEMNDTQKISGTLFWSEGQSYLSTESDTIKVNQLFASQLREGGIMYRLDAVYHLTGIAVDSEFMLYEISKDDISLSIRDENGSLLADKSDHDLKHSVDRALCIGCRLCVRQCPVGAISMSRGTAIIDETKCISCGMCKDGTDTGYNGCPVDAINSE